MPCDDWTHDHNDILWPEDEGELTIHPCERTCDYCPQNRRHIFKTNRTLRRHIYEIHIDPAPGFAPASHPHVRIKDFDGEAVKEGRRKESLAAARKRSGTSTKPSGGSTARPARPEKHSRKSASSLTASQPARSEPATATNHRTTDGNVETTGAAASVNSDNVTVIGLRQASARAQGADQTPQAAPTTTPVHKQAPSGLETLSDADFEREFKMTEARLEESRLVQKQLLMEAERARRASLC